MNSSALCSAPCAAAATLAAALLLPALSAADASSPKHYTLPATPENVQWGWYDINEKPKLTIHSGDTVSIETLPHALGQDQTGRADGGDRPPAEGK